GRLIRFVRCNPEYQIWICTSMGQAATVASPISTQLYVMDMMTFMRALGVEPGEWEQRPAMLPRYAMRVAPHKVAVLRRNLAKFHIDGMPVRVDEAEKGFMMIFLGHPNLRAPGATLDERFVPFEKMGLRNVNIEDCSGTTAYHIPQGCLFI